MVDVSLRSLVGHSLGTTHLVIEDLADAHSLSVGQASLLARRHGVDAVTRLVEAHRVDEPAVAGEPRLPRVFVDFRLADGSMPTVVDSATRVAAAAMRHWHLASGGELRLATRAGSLSMHRTRLGWATRYGRWQVTSDQVSVSDLVPDAHGTLVRFGPDYLVVPLPSGIRLETLNLTLARLSQGVSGRSVVFLQLVDDHVVAARIYEVGRGENPACGAAACAAALLARYLTGTVEPSVRVQMPAGDMRVRFPISRLEVGEWVEVEGPALVERPGQIKLGSW